MLILIFFQHFNSIPVEDNVPLVGDMKKQIDSMNASNAYPNDPSLLGNVDKQFFLEYEMRQVDNPHYLDPDLYPPGSNEGTPYSSFFTAQVNK